MRNVLATLLLSQGTPMLLAGDEFARTQQGNNNAYCQDNETSWVDWDLAGRHESLINFVKRLTALRRQYPILRRSRFLSGEMNEELGVREVTWINASGNQMEEGQWGDSAMLCFGMLLDGRAQTSGIRQRGQDATILTIFNAYHDVVRFTLPVSDDNAQWKLMLDTNQADAAASTAVFSAGEVYEVTGRSVVMLRMGAE